MNDDATGLPGEWFDVEIPDGEPAPGGDVAPRHPGHPFSAVLVGFGLVLLLGLLGLAIRLSSGEPGSSAVGTPLAVPTVAISVGTIPSSLDPGAVGVREVRAGRSCVGGDPRSPRGLLPDVLIDAYNSYDAERIIARIGDGQVADPSLDLGQQELYGSITDWFAAAEIQQDELTLLGYRFFEPFELIVTRRNPSLMAEGIEEVSVTFLIWATHDCEPQIQAADIISAPDPCRYAELVPSADNGCSGPFEPRAAHVAVWTGDEVLVYGGVSGTNDAPPLRSGLALDPVTGEAHPIADSPVGLSRFPPLQAVWDGLRMHVTGRTELGDVVVATYDPAEDSWEISPEPAEPLKPVEDTAGSGVVTFSAQSAVYDPIAATWTVLPPAPLAARCDHTGTWAGDRFVVFGGLTTCDAPNILGDGHAAAYDRATGAWQLLGS